MNVSQWVPLSDNMSAIMVNDPQYSRRGWKIAGVGLLLAFNLWLTWGLLAAWYGIGWSMFLVAIGTPIAFTGLILSIYDKWRAGARNIGYEIIVLAVLLGNTFFFATLGTIGV